MYIAIEGVIGVGKTTLARLLQQRFEAELRLEVFDENPFLSDFYADRARYAFQTQIFFLLSRYHQQNRFTPDILSQGKNLITDYTFAKDALFARINLDGDELEMYYNVHDALAEKIQLPELIVYLQASTDVLMQRIARRDRTYERQMERDYIDTLNTAYEDFFDDYFKGVPVLRIPTDDLDIVSSTTAQEQVEHAIRAALRDAPRQTQLPLD